MLQSLVPRSFPSLWFYGHSRGTSASGPMTFLGVPQSLVPCPFRWSFQFWPGWYLSPSWGVPQSQVVGGTPGQGYPPARTAVGYPPPARTGQEKGTPQPGQHWGTLQLGQDRDTSPWPGQHWGTPGWDWGTPPLPRTSIMPLAVSRRRTFLFCSSCSKVW